MLPDVRRYRRLCLFRRITGLPCLTCGMGRAWLCALRLDFVRAFFWHPLFWTVPLVALFLIFFDTRRWILRGPTACLLLFVMVYALRMLLLFPHTPPMTFDPDGILPRLFGCAFVFYNRRCLSLERWFFENGGSYSGDPPGRLRL